MHGLPPDVDLSFLIGKEIEQVAIGRYDVQINYGSGGITIHYKFRLKHPEGGEFQWQGQPEAAAPILRLVSARITGISTQIDGSVMIRFSNRALLTIFDCEGVAAYTITEQGKPTIVV